MATVELRQLRKSYGATEVIKGIDLTLRDGEFTVFVGPSGCGKSTLLRMVAGLEEITSGTLLVDGVRVNDLPPAKRGLALVFQSYALYPHMSVAENMSFSLKLAGISKAEREAKVLETARILHLEPLLQRKPKDLSGGQRQRVAIGRAIVRNPKVFLFDEPLSNLDAALRVHMRLELTKLHRELGATMIYVTHDQVEAMTMADQIVVLQGGAVEQCGSPMELYRSPKNLFVAGFIGSPRMNFLSATVGQNTGSGCDFQVGGSLLRFDDLPCAVRQGDKVTLGARPEHIRFVEAGGLRAQVLLVEHLGAESYMHLQTDWGERLTVRASGETERRAEEQVQFTFDANFLHVFDASGETLSRVPAASLASQAHEAAGSHRSGI